MSILYKILATCSWVVLICAGFWFAWQYESTSGVQAHAPSDWPVSSSLELDRGRPTLLVFAHPKCPCTRASIEQLALIASRHPGEAKIYILIVQPKGLAGNPKDSPLAKQAAGVKEATIITDPEGHEAGRFGAATSGQVLVYSRTGQKMFSGGVTSARGHFGPSSGESSVIAILNSKPAPMRTTPVFGCSLLGGS